MSHDLRMIGRKLPCSHKLITWRESSPAVYCLKWSKVERQVLHAIRAAVVEINTGRHFS